MIKRVGDYYACRDWNEEVYRTGLLNYIWQMPKAQKMVILIVCCGCVRYCVAKKFLSPVYNNIRENIASRVKLSVQRSAENGITQKRIVDA